MATATLPEKEAFTLLSPVDLCLKALELVELHSTPARLSGSVPLTDTIASITLTGDILRKLQDNDFKVGSKDDVFSIVDMRTDERSDQPSGWKATTHWNFPLRMEDDQPRMIHFSALVNLRQQRRGVTLTAQAMCNGIVAPGHNRSHFRMLQALMPYVDTGVKGYNVLAAMYDSEDGVIVVSWTDLELGGLREIGELFTEWSERNPNTERLARSTASPFDPEPYDNRPFAERRYVPEKEHPALFDCWSKELKKFQYAL